ncbi:hypothetical protein GCM10023185_45030 [Hymenobacter saemangeumensis]|uniref:Uncharacterized protein n=1 Tax=Hymenobacter saemangeumensis TaxID=1084522 RepID=A0ABP8ISG2_9BACT
MDLDELRRQWQQPEAAPPPLSPAELDELLKQKSSSLIDKMRFNARAEAAFTAVMGAAMPVLLLFVHNALRQAQVLSVFFLCLVMLAYYYRKLAMLRQMMQPEANVRGSLLLLCGGLRDMLRFNYRLCVATGPASLLLVYGYAVAREVTRPGGIRPSKLLAITGVLLGVGIVLYWGAKWLTQWYLQRLYGRHLDRLESQLRELDEPTHLALELP